MIGRTSSADLISPMCASALRRCRACGTASERFPATSGTDSRWSPERRCGATGRQGAPEPPTRRAVVRASCLPNIQDHGTIPGGGRLRYGRVCLKVPVAAQPAQVRDITLFHGQQRIVAGKSGIDAHFHSRTGSFVEAPHQVRELGIGVLGRSRVALTQQAADHVTGLG